MAAHRRWVFHLTPTSYSWINVVEGFSGKLAHRRLWSGVYESVERLEASIRDFIALRNEREAKPFKLTASLEWLIASRKRGYQMIKTHQWSSMCLTSAWAASAEE